MCSKSHYICKPVIVFSRASRRALLTPPDGHAPVAVDANVRRVHVRRLELFALALHEVVLHALCPGRRRRSDVPGAAATEAAAVGPAAAYSRSGGRHAAAAQRRELRVRALQPCVTPRELFHPIADRCASNGRAVVRVEGQGGSRRCKGR